VKPVAQPPVVPSIIAALVLTAGSIHGAEPAFHTADAQVGLNGLRVTSQRITGSDADGLDHSVGWAFRTLGYAQDDWVSVHREEHGHLGGGSAGFHGELGALLRGGLRWPFGTSHGPLIRGGIQLYVGGNDWLYHSMFELPHGQVGYQVLTDSLLLELGMQGGFTLLGHLAAGDEAERSLGQVPDWGAAAALHVNPVRIDLWWRRFEPGAEGDATGPIDTGRAQICGSAWVLAICGEGRLAMGEQDLGDGRGAESVTARQLMLTIGLGNSRARGEVSRRE